MGLGFIGMTYLHLAGATALTAVSAEYPIAQSAMWTLASLIGSLVLFFVVLWMTPGPMKYIVFAAYLFLLGQSLSRLEESLKQKGLLKEVLASVLGIFLGMTAVGIWAGDRVLGFGPLLFAGLIGLIVGRLGLLLYAGVKGDEAGQTTTQVSQILSWVGAGLFSVFVAYDTASLRARRNVKEKPDYIDSSLALFLDILNLFTNVSDIVDS